MAIHVLVLNFNGRNLLEACLPSVLRAASRSCHDCRVTVIDNSSTDDSLAWLKARHPDVPIVERPNRGLCSFNDVLATLYGSVAVLLNNDIRLAEDALDPLLAPLLPGEHRDIDCFLTAPRCYLFDGETYEGFKTAVRWRFGLVQATSLFEGHEPAIRVADLTASAGAAMAVDRRRFVELGGFDPLFLPGRLEDLDFCYRGFQAGWHARYVPESLSWHRGAGTFGPEFGQNGCDSLALRNTLLFQWKNLRHRQSVAKQVVGLVLRMLAEPMRAVVGPRERRFALSKAIVAACRRLRETEPRPIDRSSPERELEFFARFSPRLMAEAGRRQPAFELDCMAAGA